MGYKVINKNVIVNPKDNIVMDNVFFFQTKEEAEDYVNAQKSFYKHGNTRKIGACEMIIEQCTKEEDEKYVFDQYHETINPNDFKVPNLVIERPLQIAKGVPYWVTKRELLVSN